MFTKPTYSGMSWSNRGCSSTGFVTLESSGSAKQASSCRFYLGGVSSFSC